MDPFDDRIGRQNELATLRRDQKRYIIPKAKRGPCRRKRRKQLRDHLELAETRSMFLPFFCYHLRSWPDLFRPPMNSKALIRRLAGPGSNFRVLGESKCGLASSSREM